MNEDSDRVVTHVFIALIYVLDSIAKGLHTRTAVVHLPEH